MPQEQDRDRRRREFEDIHSDSGGEPRRPDFIQARAQAERRSADREWDIPQWEAHPRRRTSYDEELDRLAEEYQRPETYREIPPEPRRPRGSAGRRRGLTGLLILVMAVVTALLAIFLVFKIGRIEVTGDPIEGCTEQEIIDLCGYKLGDNLIFLGTRAQEQRLMEAIPYIGGAEIRRHLPTTLEICLTAADRAAALASEGQWLTLSGEGKILDQLDRPAEGVVKVLGLTPLDREPGQALRLEDETAQTALETILAALAPALEEWELPGRFTILDMTDLSRISLYYEDRVEFRLGNVLELDYKIRAGCRFLSDPSAGDSGVMDLTATPETKRGIFTAGTVTLPELPVTTQPETQPAQAAEPAPSATPAPRSDDIPQTAYDGRSTPAPTPTPEPEPVYDEPDDTWDEPEETWDEPEETWEEPEETWEEPEETWEENAEEDWTPEPEDETGGGE